MRLVQAAEEVVERKVGATGTLAADEQVVLGTKVAGRISELLVDLGTRVRRDQVIVRLDPTDATLFLALQLVFETIAALARKEP